MIHLIINFLMVYILLFILYGFLPAGLIILAMLVDSYGEGLWMIFYFLVYMIIYFAYCQIFNHFIHYFV